MKITAIGKTAFLLTLILAFCAAFVYYLRSADNTTVRPPVGRSNNNSPFSKGITPSVDAAPILNAELPAPTLITSLNWVATGSGPMLLNLFKSGVTSKNLESVYIASQILRACEGVLPPSVAENMISQLQINAGKSSRMQDESLRRLKGRCSVLLQIPRNEFDSMKRTLNDRISSKDFPFLSRGLLSADDVSPDVRRRELETIRKSFTDYGPAALKWLDSDLIDALAVKKDLSKLDPSISKNIDDRDFAKRYTAVTLALCEAGYPCDVPSSESDNVCMIGHCGSGLREALLLQFTPDERKELTERGKVIYKLITEHDWKSLGLQ